MRISEIVAAEFAQDKLVQEDRLQVVINDQVLDVKCKMKAIKKILKQMVLTESMYMKWYNIVNANNEATEATDGVSEVQQ